MTNRIGIAGISGRMGRLLAEEAEAAGTLVGGIDRTGSGPEGVTLFDDISALGALSDVVVDFTHASTVAGHAAALAAAGTPWVLGTTGYSAEDGAAIVRAATVIPIIAAPNYCTGVNLLLLLAEKLGAALPAGQYDAEILEMHHRQKVDAPSGTALGLGRAVAAGRGVQLEDVMVTSRSGHTGARGEQEIGFATLRGGQIVGSHTVMFTAGDEQIALTHHAFDRRVFASGAVRAALWLQAQKPGLYTMRDVLGL
ncbi:MAG: 4-hydroxy-tetrahydrodipicolinate reductase [Acidocella sp. 20-63-7]|nr:MAG: 4-hydroxy-tetrahydrodipicolinate reductase [Acidocella sp. 20-63-7]HQT46159.1 4-hydroxy-tetrahydrodipicolinate reductase [Acidocella sp.]